MSFINRHKATVTLTAAFVLIAGGAYMTGYTGCGSNCAISSFLGVTDAYAGPGCASAAKGESASAKSGNKEAHITTLITEKGMTRQEAEAHYAKSQETTQGTLASASSGASDTETAAAKVTTAGAKGHGSGSSGCGMKATGSSGCGMKKSGSNGCGMKKTDGASGCGGGSKAMKADASANTHSRDACIDACVAKGMSKADATAAADKCEQAGFHNASATSGDTKAAKKSGCCAKSKSTASAASTSATPGGSK